MKQKILQYQSGFGNEFQTESVPKALPVNQNSPQKCPLGLYAEQISGSAFTAPRHEVLRTWLYRILPSVCHKPFEPFIQKYLQQPTSSAIISPNQYRWNPLEVPTHDNIHFINGWRTICTTGNIEQRTGSTIHLYVANKSMQHEYFYNSDAETLIVPQEGQLLIKTEMGHLQISPLEIAVIPRGIVMQIQLLEKRARGYICENFGWPLTIPDKGPIGSNGLANPRDFLYPTASYEERQGNFKLINKFNGQLWQADIDHSPLNVVAWHGNYAPYKYNLENFNVINSVSYDHCDPSIFTVLTSPSGLPGTANLDFVIFPPRWLVAENTFRPPWFHRNVMSEYMGLIKGTYDAKTGGKDGFVPGGGSLHNCMSAHGPDSQSFEKASSETLKPTHFKETMAFMFESRTFYQPTDFALNSNILQKDYYKCWQNLKPNFRK